MISNFKNRFFDVGEIDNFTARGDFCWESCVRESCLGESTCITSFCEYILRLDSFGGRMHKEKVNLRGLR